MKMLFEKLKTISPVRRNILAGVVGGVCLILLLITESSDGSDSPSPYENTAEFASDYLEKTERELSELIEDIEGAGEVEVMITLESCYENVYAKGFSLSEDIKDAETQKQVTDEYVIIRNGSNTEECLVVKVYEPIVKGVAVVADGADNTTVKKAITDTVCALFDISSNKVSVNKKYEE